MDGRSPITGSQTPNNPRVRTVGFSLSGGAGDQDEDPDVFQLDSGSSPSAPLPVIIPPAFQVSVRGASGPAYGAVDAGVHADNNGGSQRLLNSLTARLALSLPGSACFRNHARCRLLVSCACAGRGAASLLSPCRLSRPACASFAAVCTPGPQDCAYVRWAARAGDHLPVGHPAAAVAGQPPAGPCFQHSHGHGTSAAARGRRRPRPWGRASRGGRRQAQERAAGGAEAEVESGRAARDPGGAACGQGGATGGSPIRKASACSQRVRWRRRRVRGGRQGGWCRCSRQGARRGQGCRCLGAAQGCRVRGCPV